METLNLRKVSKGSKEAKREGKEPRGETNKREQYYGVGE